MMVNRGLGSPSQRGGPGKLLMSPSGRDREFKLTLLVYDAGQRHIAERRATRLSSASTNGVIANSSANPPGLRRRATNAACTAAARARQSGAPTPPGARNEVAAWEAWHIPSAVPRGRGFGWQTGAVSAKHAGSRLYSAPPRG